MEIAIIGGGYWGQKVLTVARKIQDLRIKTVFDTDKNAMNLAQKIQNFRIYGSLNEILNDEKIVAIFVVTPMETHEEITRQALLAGKNVFVEKPLAMNFFGAKNLISLARKQKKILHADHIFLHENSVIWLKENLKKITKISAQRLNLPDPKNSTKPCILRDLGVHDLSIFDFILRMENDFSLRILRRHEKKFKKHIDFLLNDVEISLTLSFEAPKKTRFMKIFGENFRAIYDDTAAQKIQIFSGSSQNFPKISQEISPLEKSIVDFIKKIRGENDNHYHEEHVLRVAKMIDFLAP